MPIERLSWRALKAWDALNAQMGRVVDVLVGSDRYAVLVADATATLALTYPLTMVESDTTAGAVALTLPEPATVPGFRVDFVKTGGGNSLTVNGNSLSATGAFVSNSTTWRRVG